MKAQEQANQLQGEINEIAAKMGELETALRAPIAVDPKRVADLAVQIAIERNDGKAPRIAQVVASKKDAYEKANDEAYGRAVLERQDAQIQYQVLASMLTQKRQQQAIIMQTFKVAPGGAGAPVAPSGNLTMQPPPTPVRPGAPTDGFIAALDQALKNRGFAGWTPDVTPEIAQAVPLAKTPQEIALLRQGLQPELGKLDTEIKSFQDKRADLERRKALILQGVNPDTNAQAFASLPTLNPSRFAPVRLTPDEQSRLFTQLLLKESELNRAQPKAEAGIARRRRELLQPFAPPAPFSPPAPFGQSAPFATPGSLSTAPAF